MKKAPYRFRYVPLAALGLTLAGASLVVACSGSGDGSSSGSSGRTGADPTPDAATAEDADAGSTGTKASGDDCAGNGECKSGHCLTQGAGMGDSGGGGGGGGGDGGKPGSFCSVSCATANQNPAPECSDPVFTGKCSGRLLCQIK